MSRYEEIKKHPEEIKKLRIELIEKYLELENVRSEVKKVEKETYVEVDNEVDEKNKKIFSNETKRQVEVNERISKSKTYTTLSTQLKNLEIEIKKIEVEVEYRKNMLKIIPLLDMD